MFGDEVTVVQTVVGGQMYNGIDCYIVNNQINSQDTVTETIDKTTLKSIRTETYPINETGNGVIMDTSCNYSVKPYPLSVGKTWTVAGNFTQTLLLPGGNQTTTETFSNTYKVESIEGITVPAGIFQCFKIVRYDSNNSVIETDWVTDVTKGVSVKSVVNLSTDIPNMSEFTIELISYSLAE